MNDINIDEKEELLIIFMEECAEASVEASKIIRFGQNDEEVGSLVKEVGDLVCMINLFSKMSFLIVIYKLDVCTKFSSRTND